MPPNPRAPTYSLFHLPRPHQEKFSRGSLPTAAAEPRGLCQWRSQKSRLSAVCPLPLLGPLHSPVPVPEWWAHLQWLLLPCQGDQTSSGEGCLLFCQRVQELPWPLWHPRSTLRPRFPMHLGDICFCVLFSRGEEGAPVVFLLKSTLLPGGSRVSEPHFRAP